MNQRNPDNIEDACQILDLRARNGDYLNTTEFPPLQYAVDGLIPEGLTILAAPPKCGKSWLVLGVCLAAAGGTYALGHIPVKPRKVLYLALEDGDRRMQSRCRQLLDNTPIPSDFAYVTEAAGMWEVIELIAGFTSRHDDALIVLDTLGKVTRDAAAGESSYSRDYRSGGQLKQLADAKPGTSIVVVHHTRKAASVTGDFIDDLSGTQGIAGAADAILVLRRPRNDTAGTLHVTGRDVLENEYALDYSNGSWLLAASSLEDASYMVQQRKREQQYGDGSREVIEFVESRDETTPSDLVEKFSWDARKAQKYLARLTDSGEIRKLGRGTYTGVRSTET